MSVNIRPEDDLYIFVYDKDQIFLPPFSRIYGSDFRKLSQVSMGWEKGITILNNDNKSNRTLEPIKFKINLFLRYGRRSPSMATIFTMSFSGLTIWIMI